MVRILGIGSPSGDDQAGWLTVDALLASGVHTDGELVTAKLARPGANNPARNCRRTRSARFSQASRFVGGVNGK